MRPRRETANKVCVEQLFLFALGPLPSSTHTLLVLANRHSFAAVMLLKSLSPLLGYLAVCQTVSASLLPRGGDDSGGHPWINHDAVVPFTQKASVVGGSLELRFNPFLFVSGGCDPYPAVDAQGNLG